MLLSFDPGLLGIGVTSISLCLLFVATLHVTSLHWLLLYRNMVRNAAKIRCIKVGVGRCFLPMIYRPLEIMLIFTGINIYF